MLRAARGVGGGLNRLRCIQQQQPGGGKEVSQGQQDGVPWLFVGVGNPGPKFLGTRHNVGFEVIDAFSKAEGIALNTIQHNAIIGEGSIEGVPVVLAKPQTYANLIGESVALLLEHHGLPVDKMVVVFDDMETRMAKFFLSPKGGHGNHRGLINLIAHLKGNRNFSRLKIGIGSPPEKMDSKAYVLQKFCEQERKMVFCKPWLIVTEMESSISQGVGVLRLIATTGVANVIDGMTESREWEKPQ